RHAADLGRAVVHVAFELDQCAGGCGRAGLDEHPAGREIEAFLGDELERRRAAIARDERHLRAWALAALLRTHVESRSPRSISRCPGISRSWRWPHELTARAREPVKFTN